MGLGIGADGLKTGHTQEAGYGLVGSAQQGERRIVFVLSGLSSTNQRADEAEAIVNWAFRQFTTRSFGKSGDVVTRATVWDGSNADVGLEPLASAAISNNSLKYVSLFRFSNLHP